MAPPEEDTHTIDVFGEGRKRARESMAGLVLLYAEDSAGAPAAAHGDPLVIGRDPPTGIRLTHGSVSRVHARIARRGAGWIVSDLESRNGTIVNGVRVSEAELEDGDEVGFGTALFKFTLSDADEHARHPLVPARAEAPFHKLVGRLSMARLGAAIATVAPSNLSVLVLGETGTGKELVSRAIHDASKRRGRFAAVNCAAIPENLIESELFGHKRGAFTGADRDRAGIVQSADGGTLLLDEIGDMPAPAQAKLLRLLESREVLPVGATIPERVDIRLVCATHKNLEALVADGRFRRDLYARINGYKLRLHPLRERKEDIVAIVRSILDDEGRSAVVPSPAFFLAVCHYDWPYNVRELHAAVRRALTVARGPAIDEVDLPEEVRDAFADFGKVSAVAPRARDATPSEADVRSLLHAHQGNITAMARATKKDRVQIHRWLRRYGLVAADFRAK